MFSLPETRTRSGHVSIVDAGNLWDLNSWNNINPISHVPARDGPHGMCQAWFGLRIIPSVDRCAALENRGCPVPANGLGKIGERTAIKLHGSPDCVDRVQIRQGALRLTQHSGTIKRLSSGRARIK
jgi:hypothetical protein